MLDGITDSMEMVMDREALRAAVHEELDTTD